MRTVDCSSGTVGVALSRKIASELAEVSAEVLDVEMAVDISSAQEVFVALTSLPWPVFFEIVRSETWSRFLTLPLGEISEESSCLM